MWTSIIKKQTVKKVKTIFKKQGYTPILKGSITLLLFHNVFYINVAPSALASRPETEHVRLLQLRPRLRSP